MPPPLEESTFPRREADAYHAVTRERNRIGGKDVEPPLRLSSFPPFRRTVGEVLDFQLIAGADRRQSGRCEQWPLPSPICSLIATFRARALCILRATSSFTSLAFYGRKSFSFQLFLLLI